MSKVFYSMICCYAVAIVFMAYVDVSCAANCQSVVVKEQEGVLNWLGNVTFSVPVAVTNGWRMVGTFDYAFTGVGVWDVWVDNAGSSSGITIFTDRKPEHLQLAAGQILTFRFRVNYGRDIPQPKLISLKFEDRELCQ